jgi:hypothetical protein
MSLTCLLLTLIPQAVKELSTAFQSITSLAHVARLWKRIKSVEGRLRAEIEGEFDHL